jgi:sugar phosphate isomerase/epimerase
MKQIRALVDFEMDLYWVVRADMIRQLFKEHPGRFKMWHVKDMDKVNPDWNAEIELEVSI